MHEFLMQVQSQLGFQMSKRPPTAQRQPHVAHSQGYSSHRREPHVEREVGVDVSLYAVGPQAAIPSLMRTFRQNINLRGRLVFFIV